MDSNTEKIAYGSNLTVFAFNGNGKIPVLYGGYTIATELSEDLVSENNYNLITEEEITSINIKITNADSTSERTYTFPLEEGQILNGNDYIDSEGLHIGDNLIAFTAEQEEAYQALQNIPLYEGISHIIVTDATPAVLKLSYNSVEEDNQIYVLNKNEQLLAIFNKDDDETLINPRIEKRQNSESVFTFTIDAKNPKWNEINNPENLYVVDGMMFSTNFDGSFKENISENDEKTIEVTAYERQQLLSRKFVRAWNSETNLEKIDTFMVVILSNGNLPLKNNGIEITTRYPKGSSGYVLEGLLYGTGWTVGTCDIYEYENGQVVKDENNNPVYSKFDLETDQVNIYDNILKVQELWGGILVFDSLNKIVHHRDETLYLPYNGYEVRYQKNMQSLEKEYNNKIITKLCPLGEGGLNIANVNDGSVWLENYSYTDTVLEGIENAPDITDQAQLKRWGERKLEMLCQPTIELDVNLALMYQLEGYELETVDLNHIVDVINYNDVDTDYIQLRVVEFSYSVWNKSDATVKLSNITLDSTDIFRKAVKATNIINTGTLEASKVINIYKGGQSVEQTMIVLDGKAEFSYSELTRTDTGIIARVTHTEDKYNTLSGTVGRHTEEIGSWDITSGSIASSISKTTSELNTVSGQLEVTSSKVNILERNVSELNSKIQDIADITTYGENDKGKVELNDINESEPIMIKVHPTTTTIDYLYPTNNLYPSDTLYLKDRRIRFERTYDEDGITKIEYIYYELPDGLLRYNDEIYDEFLLDYDNKICQVIKRCGYNADGTVYQLAEPQTMDYPYPTIYLGDGDYKISLLGYDNAYIYVRLMAKNIYTTQFATRAEVHTEIDQTAASITTMVSGTYERKDHAESSYSQLQQTTSNISATVANNNTKANIIAKINDNTSQAQINADAINLLANDVLNILSGNTIDLGAKTITITSNNFTVDSSGNIRSNSGVIGGFTLGTTRFTGNLNGIYDYNNYDLRNVMCIQMDWLANSSIFQNIYDVNNDGYINTADTLKIKRILLGLDQNTKNVTGNVYINSTNPKNCIQVTANGETAVSIGVGGINTILTTTQNFVCGTATDTGYSGITINGDRGHLYLIQNNQKTIELHPDGNVIGNILTANSQITNYGTLYNDGAIRSIATYDNNTVTNSPNMYVTSKGWFRRTTNTSSKRYKTDIKNIENMELTPEKLYDLPVRQFKYKSDYLKTKDDPRYNKDLIGFIAEEVAEYYPIAVDYEIDEEGNKYIENWNEKYMIPPMLNLIQKLNKRVKILEEKIKGGNK